MPIAAMTRTSLHTTPALRTWRAATATRCFTLALTAGLLLSRGAFGDVTAVLAAVVLINVVGAAVEWGSPAAGAFWVPMGEAVLVALVLTSTPFDPSLLVALAAPPIVAGLRSGFVPAVNCVLLAGLAIVLTDPTRIAESAPWLVAGLGVGALASWQSRSLREITARQEPYAAAHELMTGLHSLASRGALGLDSTLLAHELAVSLGRATGAAGIGVFVLRDGAPDLLSATGDGCALHEMLETEPSRRPSSVAVIPLSGGDALLGQIVLVRAGGWTLELLEQARHIADVQALRLDTAALFDGVRSIATAEERTRIAREMHDGVAQEVVALGFLVDEIEDVSEDTATRELAASLRSEITRVVSELRFSIFDLRHTVSDGRLSGALADYVGEVSQGMDLNVHLRLEESGPSLPARTESELLRIGQEAICNVRKHARASNLWVTLCSDGSSVRLEIEDDGTGHATPREGHWGLQTMRERAELIGATLTLDQRAAGGTIVRLQTTQFGPPEGVPHHEHLSPAHR